MAISSKPTSGQVHVSLAENHRSIQCRRSDNFRIARHSPQPEITKSPSCFVSGSATSGASNGNP